MLKFLAIRVEVARALTRGNSHLQRWQLSATMNRYARLKALGILGKLARRSFHPIKHLLRNPCAPLPLGFMWGPALGTPAPLAGDNLQDTMTTHEHYHTGSRFRVKSSNKTMEARPPFSCILREYTLHRRSGFLERALGISMRIRVGMQHETYGDILTFQFIFVHGVCATRF
jgi:hypothetical protein